MKIDTKRLFLSAIEDFKKEYVAFDLTQFDSGAGGLGYLCSGLLLLALVSFIWLDLSCLLRVYSHQSLLLALFGPGQNTAPVYCTRTHHDMFYTITTKMWTLRGF